MTEAGPPIPFRIQLHRELDDAVLDTLAAFDRRIFSEPFTRDHIAHELRGRRGLCILFAVRGAASSGGSGPGVVTGAGEALGYKVGYELSVGLLFSYIGGVLPEHRGSGVASALMAEQHRLAAEWGYSVVRTHTRNEFRSMLLLNIRSGFDVTGVNHKTGESKLTIILEKRLSNLEPKA